MLSDFTLREAKFDKRELRITVLLLSSKFAHEVRTRPRCLEGGIV